VPFALDDLERIEAARLVRIETQRPDGPVHLATIWAVVDGERVFVRSWRGVGARWYREALAHPAVAIHVRRHRIPATAVPATDPDSIERASAGLLRKYEGDPATASMVRDEILGTTLRLEPI
jgi:hypothetical protein